jgi:hypothetical protein
VKSTFVLSASPSSHAAQLSWQDPRPRRTRDVEVGFEKCPMTLGTLRVDTGVGRVWP